jgi:hypothetical protein
LLSSLLQLTARSDAFYDVLKRSYEEHDKGSRHPSERDLIDCLFAFRRKGKVYIIVDAPRRMS